jgi:hypothetical protein
MNKALILVAAAACCAAAPTTATAAKKKPLPDCAARKSTTLAASADARVYSVGSTAYLCAYKKNKRFALGDSHECQNQTEVGDFRFGDGVIGYLASSCGLVSGQSSVVVRDLKTGKVKWSGSPVDQAWQGGESSKSIDTWAMKPNGSIAWIGRNSGFVTVPGGPPAPAADTIQVWKNEQGTATKLDSGADIVRGSLALGSESDTATGAAPVYWRKGAAVFTATVK